ncbi:MAG: 2-oxoacid:acceptor oxidoreductase family protein [Gammaproteobacteria bacterium]|nr:2-oxoacid:acceptor oxidoreductase family protein [Gammaproteobacteria bacterium]
MPDFEVRISGSGGQGILLAGRILADALGHESLNVAQSQSYEPTSRGGLSRADLVASDAEVDYPLASDLDFLVILDEIATTASNDLLQQDSLVLVDSPLQDQCKLNGHEVRYLPISDSARALGDLRSTNMVALGALNSLADFCSQDKLLAAVARIAPAKLHEAASRAIRKGYSIAAAE